MQSNARTRKGVPFLIPPKGPRRQKPRVDKSLAARRTSQRAKKGARGVEMACARWSAWWERLLERRGEWRGGSGAAGGRERTEVKGFGVFAGDLAAALVSAVEHVRRDGWRRRPDAGGLAFHATFKRELLHLTSVGGDDILRPALERGGRRRGAWLHKAGGDTPRARAR
jgi:hypothetical protein